MHLVRAGQEIVLVGVAEHAVVPIRIYGEAEARAAGLLDESSADADDDIPSARPAPPAVAAVVRDLLSRLQQRTVRS
jgi:flagellar protein FliO/FliZ